MNCERLARLLAGALTVALARGTIAFLLALGATGLARKLPSQARHLIWLGAVASFLLIPLAWLALPAVRVGGWIRMEAAAARGVLAAPVLARREYMLLAERSGQYVRLSGQPLAPGCLWPAVLLTWFGGVSFQVVRLLVGGWRLRRLCAGAAKDPGLWRLAMRLAGEPACRKLSVLRSPRCGVPFTFGLLRPVVMLPAGVYCWPTRRLRSALVHELAHVRRRDVLAQSAAYAICLLFWFIPLVLARSSAGRLLLPAASGGAGMPGGMAMRIRNLMSLRPDRRPLGTLGTLRVLAILLICLLPLLTVTCSTKPSPERLHGIGQAWIDAGGRGGKL
jgi:beta-lactamase regulating signal transducer with metallopeptidase domain